MAAISSVGSIFGANTVIGTITAISLGGISTAEIDTTALASTSKEYVMGTIDGGTVDVTVNLATGSTVDLPTAGDNAPTAFKLKFGTWVSGAAVPFFTFDAYIQNVSVEASVDAQVTASYTLRITGSVTVALATTNTAPFV